VFERYSELARRIIFFARYEASNRGSAYIEAEHLLLGLLREDPVLGNRLSIADRKKLRDEIEAIAPPIAQGVSTSVDLPLSRDSKRALSYGAEEAERLAHKVIDSGHLALGLLRVEGSAVVSLLGSVGITLANLRVDVARHAGPGQTRGVQPQRRSFEGTLPSSSAEAETVCAPSLVEQINLLTHLVFGTIEHLNDYSENDTRERLKRSSWSRKEALGHLVDWAIVHHAWVARALTEPKVPARGYPDEAWVSAQQYSGYPWPELVDTWLSLNRLILYVWMRIPEARATVPCRIGIEEPVPLSKLLARYVEHCEDITGQILARL
jgi:hypothetical protein